MIIFDLRCAPQGHVFEAWFGSSEDYDSQLERGLVACAICGSDEVEKAPMAPRVGVKGNQSAVSGPPGQSDYFSAEPEKVKAMLAALATAQRELLRRSENVGSRFADEARAIHLGEADARAIYGQASRSEAEALLGEGIAVAPLLFELPEPKSEH